MSDDAGLRDIERRSQQTGAIDDEARLLSERIRAGQVQQWELIQRALSGDPVARLVASVPDTDNLPRIREFLNNLAQHDQEARATLTHYELVQEGDKTPPDTATALTALMDDLRSNQNHREAINQMQRPVLQLVPVYEPEGVGFQRMISAFDDRGRVGQRESYVYDDLMARWGMSGAAGKIVRWQVVVVEGAKELDQASNPHAGDPLEVESNGELTGQLPSWRKHCRDRDLQLCDNRSYELLQMQEFRQAPEGTPLEQLGIDPQRIDHQTGTVLEDTTRLPGSEVTLGNWYQDRVFFREYRRLVFPLNDVRFRPMVVIDII